MYKLIINKSEKYYNLVGIVREIVTSFKFVWFDILDENGLPFIKKTANRFTPESMFYGPEKTAHRLDLNVWL